MTSFSIRNFGCRVNQAEAFAWAEELQRQGLTLEERWDRSDFILINSCTLTSRADRDVKRFVHKAVRGNPTARLIVTGCYAERAFEEWQSMPGVWMVVRNGEKPNLAAKVLASAGSREARTAKAYRSRALVKIQDGCDFGCTYCIIPSVRGKSVSLKENEVLARITGLVEAGYQEIVLAGIHLCSYGFDFVPKRSLRDLLRGIESVKGLGRIRLSSLDPRLVDWDLADYIASNPRICPHFHLSLQNGSEKVLEGMGRPAGRENYLNLIDRLRRISPSAALGADFIIGFPGETNDDFEMTRELLADTPLTYAHVFPYSSRQGTKAARMEPIDDRIKKTRASELRSLARLKNLAFRRQCWGRELEAVVIQKKGRTTEVLTGNAIKVIVPDSAAPERQTVTVRITDVTPLGTSGEIL